MTRKQWTVLFSAVAASCVAAGLTSPGQAQTKGKSVLPPIILGCPSDMVRIAAGTYTIGSTAGGNEGPAHTQAVSKYCLDPTEVTVAKYKACVTAGVCGAPGNATGCNWNVAGKDNHPINCVTWDHAEAYCAWNGNRRLPTEAEWEIAARHGADGFKWAWGNTFDATKACFNRSSTCPVDAYPAFSYGLRGMNGNVWEWVKDSYQASYQTGMPTDYWYNGGPTTSKCKRGGGFGEDQGDYIRSTTRYDAYGGGKSPNLGFRCAKTAT